MNKIKKKGYTLVELLLYVGLSSILLLVSVTFLTSLLKTRTEQSVVAEVEQQALQIMQQVTQALRNAEAITSPRTGESSETLLLLVNNREVDAIAFSLDEGTFLVTEGNAPPIPLTNEKVIVSELTFQNLSRPDTPGLIRTHFNLTYLNNTGRSEFDYSKHFYTSTSLRHP